MLCGSRGVILAIQRHWADVCELTRHNYHNMPYMKGHAVGVSLQLPDGPKLELIGAYLPSSGGIDIGEEEKAIHKRERIYSAFRQQVADKQYVLAAGDWNAAFLPADRSHPALHTQADRRHQQFVAENALKPLPCKAAGRIACTPFDRLLMQVARALMIYWQVRLCSTWPRQRGC